MTGLAARSSEFAQPTTSSDWADWFFGAFLTRWIEQARDHRHGGYFDTLDANGEPVADAPKTVLAQARLLYTFAHLAELSDDDRFRAAVAEALAVLPRFRKPNGLYCRALTREGGASGEAGDGVARSYDQSFVILALSTWQKISPSAATAAELEACWSAIEANLRDSLTGLLVEDDSVFAPAASDAPMRAQNPHMHLYEAALQAFETSGETRWLERAAALREVALAHFFDPQSGTITEFLAPDLSVHPGKAGRRREIGHQCEWAWLLRREMTLGGKADLTGIVAALEGFALGRGFAPSGPMEGAAFDAVSADGEVMEASFLLWPQTEAIKMHATRHLAGEAEAADAGRHLMTLMFERYFRDRPIFVNQLDGEGGTLWPEALSRLLYHIVLALTEGARAGFWPGPTRHS